MFFVYIVPALEAELKGKFRSISSAIGTLKDRVEQSQSTGSFERFADGYIVKHLVGNNYRLIARKEIISDNDESGEKKELLVFFYLLNRKDPSYTDASSGFCKDAGNFAKLHHFEWPSFKEDCRSYFEKRSQEDKVVKPKAELSGYEYNILYEMMYGHKDSGKPWEIYEMKDWVRSLKHVDNTDIRDSFIHDLYKSVVDVALDAACNPKDPDFCIGEVSYGSNYKKYFAYYFNQTENVIFLGLIARAKEDVQEFIEKNREFFANFNKERAVKRSLRSYSDAVVANEKDHTQWQKIESDASNNMALSSEELEVLESVQNSESRKYPLFINGRAGSGKSTILQFTFASYYYNYLKSEDGCDASPVYFTYNDKLLTTARETVDSLLENQDYLGYRGNDETTRNRIRRKKDRSRESVYRNFSAFLLEVAKQDKDFCFLPQDRLTFQKFREMWNEQFKSNREVRRKLNPEICWHVIRTYIKGYSVDTPIDVLSFENEVDCTISKETFKLIYNEVWRPWYSQLALYSSIEDTEGGTSFNRNFQAKSWDDQDLVHYVLEVDEKNAESKSLLDRYFEKHQRYSAVFCDESQDFTQIELEAILNTSLFLQRKVPDRDVHRIPFVFAGDPFQTLNPTGFSWNTVKDRFVGVIARSLDVKADDVKMNYKELKSNYRSEQEIVKVSNGVQMVRAVKLNPDKSVIEPQLPWSDEKGSAMFFDWSNAGFWKWLESNQTVSIILPCESDSKYDYVENNKFLKEHVCCVDGGNGDKKRYKYPIFSAQDVKGLEYDTVIVYGFGSFNDDDIGNRFKKLFDDETATEKSSLELEYFINRLYVAVTRPKKQLFILDDKETFWSGFSKKNSDDDSAIVRLAKLIPQNCREAWGKDDDLIKEKMSVPVYGRTSDLKGEKSAEDRERFAAQLYQEGVDNRDVDRLEYALTSYSSIFGGENSKCREIQACIHYLNKEYRAAAKVFSDAGYNVPAHHCWFLDLPVPVESGPAIYGMRILQRDDRDCEESNERMLAECAFENISVDGFCKSLRECSEGYRDYQERCQHTIFSWDIDFEKWQALFNHALKLLSNKQLAASDVDRIVEALENQEVIDFDALNLANFYFVNKRYEKIAELGTKNTSQEVQDVVKKAKIYGEGFPKNLPALVADKNYELICKIWDEQGEAVVDSLDVADVKNVCLAHREMKREINEKLLVRMFNKFIDSKTWADYYRNLTQKTYRHETVQILSSIVNGRQDKKVAQKIHDGFKKNAGLNTVEEFNAIYTYCLGVVNEHPTELDLKACYNLLKGHFVNMQPAVERLNMSFAEVCQIGRFVEYVSGQLNENDRDRYWGYALDFYRKILDLNLYNKPEQLLYLRKRMIFCAENRFIAYDAIVKKPGQKLSAQLKDNTIFTYSDYQREIEHLRSDFGIAEKIERVTSGKADDTMCVAAAAWRNDGYLVKHATEPMPEQTAETAVEPVVETATEIVAEPVVETVVEPAVDFVEQIVEPAAESVAEPIVETADEPVSEPAAEIAVEPIVETATETIVEPVEESVAETVVEPAVVSAESVVESVVETVVEPAAESVPDIKIVETEIEIVETEIAEVPQELNLECCGYLFRKADDEEFAVEIYAKQDKDIYLGTCNSYGFSPKHQKNFVSKNPPSYKYGNLPSFVIKETEDYYSIGVGIISLFVKKLDN